MALVLDIEPETFSSHSLITCVIAIDPARAVLEGRYMPAWFRTRRACNSGCLWPVFQEAAGENAGVHGAAEERKEKVPSPHLSQLVVLTNSGTLYGLAQRVVATESL